MIMSVLCHNLVFLSASNDQFLSKTQKWLITNIRCELGGPDIIQPKLKLLQDGQGIRKGKLIVWGYFNFNDIIYTEYRIE